MYPKTIMSCLFGLSLLAGGEAAAQATRQLAEMDGKVAVGQVEFL